MVLRWRINAAVLAGLLATGMGLSQQQGPVYPDTRQVDHVDVYHGANVADPYRWLEQDVREEPAVADWVEAENKVTLAYLDTIPQREAIRRRLTQLWNFEKYEPPVQAGGRYFFRKNDGLQDQSVLYRMDSLAAAPQVLLDPNTWSNDGTEALTSIAPSPDGRYLAYGVAQAGSDWQTWHVIEVPSGRVLDDKIAWVKFSDASWTRDGRGFFYSRFDEPKEGAEFQGLNLNHKVYYHRLGTPQGEDVLAYQQPDHPDWMFFARTTEDGRFVVITAQVGTDERHRIAYRDLTEPYGLPTDLITNFEHEYTFVAGDGPVLYFQTNLDAPRRRLIAIDTRQPERDHWIEIIPQADDTLQQVTLVGNLLIASYLKDAKTAVKIFKMDGEFVRDVEFSTIATATGFGGGPDDTETFYSMMSYTLPPTIYRYDLISGKSTVFRQPKVTFTPEDFEVKQVFYRSKDGTRMPMFLAHKKGISLDGGNPTLLYGYGGFDISLTPRFLTARIWWLEQGGVLAVPNLRGGGEYGEAWHKAGTKLQKQNVFDDFIAAAEWLVQNNYTRKQKLAIQGRSNGGLLVGAAMTQRPDLFGAALPAVGVMDMLRFHKFTAGRFWTDDYGSADDPEQFKALLAYSPYHNIRKGTCYPPTLVTTADTDDRVVPGHSFKFIARLQAAQSCPNAVLARIETRAGHGSGKPTSKQIEEAADEWAFLVRNLSVEEPATAK
ncbi:MAG: prolyl oligopeptidase family serine peptidase [Acidobacteria bacterium]|nr:prolyl oligopeptidase family serine peptidase [Acidobacteriota bacterium]